MEALSGTWKDAPLKEANHRSWGDDQWSSVRETDLSSWGDDQQPTEQEADQGWWDDQQLQGDDEVGILSEGEAVLISTAKGKAPEQPIIVEGSDTENEDEAALILTNKGKAREQSVIIVSDSDPESEREGPDPRSRMGPGLPGGGVNIRHKQKKRTRSSVASDEDNLQLQGSGSRVSFWRSLLQTSESTAWTLKHHQKRYRSKGSRSHDESDYEPEDVNYVSPTEERTRGEPPTLTLPTVP